MSKHKRRKDYWKNYHMAHTKELAFLIAVIAELVTKYPCPRPQATRGRPPKHSKAKLDFVWEMDRYETVEKNGLKKRRKKYAKYHVTSILGLQIVLDSRITSSNTRDTKVLGPMIETISGQGLDMGTSIHSCDTAYDAEENFELLFEHKLDPNIRQRPPGKNPEKSKEDTPNRAKGAEMFDPVEYKKRDMVEDIFGAEEAIIIAGS